MITATTKSGDRVRVNFVINRGQWFGETWLITGCVGNAATWAALVEADHEQEAIDVLAESRRRYLIEDDTLCDCCEANKRLAPRFETEENCECQMAGNDCHRVNLNDIRIDRVVVDYFAKATD